jgi:hypothetical protein
MRAVASAPPIGFAAWLFWVGAKVIFHSHAGEHPREHEWDGITLPITFAVAFVSLFAGLGTLHNWSSRRTWGLIAGSPVIAVALAFVLAWVRWQFFGS